MKMINWKRTNWTARKFIFSIEQAQVGQLTFNHTWKFDANFTDHQTQLKFTQKSFWDRDVLIKKDGKRVGELQSGLFGEQKLKLATGEIFFISTSFWGQEAYWKTIEGETIITYKQAAMSSLENGLIKLNASLTSDIEKLLISTGLFARLVSRKRIAQTVAVMIPILTAASQW